MIARRRRTSRTCSTRVISTSRTEVASRASHSTTGTVASKSKASRTFSTGWRATPSKQLTATRNGDAALLEVVDGREAVGEPPGVGHYHRAESAQGQLVPQEPEPVLARRAEQVEHQIVTDVIRPKSMVTVVVALPSTPATSSARRWRRSGPPRSATA